MSSIYVELFRYQPGTKNNFTNPYWLATRGSGMDYNETRIYFCGYVVSGDTADDISLDSTMDSANKCNYAIRPVVDIDLSKVIISDSGNGYSIDPKSQNNIAKKYKSDYFTILNEWQNNKIRKAEN